jgi:multidrug efflux pump subunit AcrA (membrane-fusion protein)
LVPKDAVVLGGVTPLVYVVAPDPMDSSKTVARPVPVRLGVCDGEMIQVIGELAEGQAVVVKGNERLRPGQAIVAR